MYLVCAGALLFAHRAATDCLLIRLYYNRLIAVTISRAKLVPAEEARRICLDYTLTGLDTMFWLSSRGTASRPFRFLYVSGAKSERDPSKKPWILGNYILMRVSGHLFSNRLAPSGLFNRRVLHNANCRYIGRGGISCPRIC